MVQRAFWSLLNLSPWQTVSSDKTSMLYAPFILAGSTIVHRLLVWLICKMFTTLYSDSGIYPTIFKSHFLRQALIQSWWLKIIGDQYSVEDLGNMMLFKYFTICQTVINSTFNIHLSLIATGFYMMCNIHYSLYFLNFNYSNLIIFIIKGTHS